MTTKLQRARATMKCDETRNLDPQCGTNSAPFAAMWVELREMGHRGCYTEHHIAASLLLDGSPGGRWPHPPRRTGAKR